MRVLIIDDSSLFHKILVETIGGDDVTPEACQTMAEGMEKLKADSFDFICVSMHLKDGDGITFTRNLRQLAAYKNTPVVLFTSEDSREVYIQALSSGVTEVFHKKDLQHLTNFIQRLSLQQQSIEGRVLYVEDAQSQRELVVSLFTSRGLKVDSFSTAEEAWEAYISHDYDLVVTDIVLEGNMTGKALTNHIRRLDGEKGDVPILALTGFDDISRRIDLFYLGVTDYVIKPLVEEELLARVRNLIKSKQFHMEAVKQRLRAEEADQAKSDFISQMSHELRTPLNAILGFSQLLESDEGLDGEQQDSVSEISKAGQHLLELINEILDIAKIESGRLDLSQEGVTLSPLVDDCFSLIAPVAERNGIGVSHGEIGDGVVHADRVRLKQVLLNLLSNAIKYNRENGKVELSVSEVDKAMLRITISDTGRGIDQDRVGELFQPFNRLDSEKSEIEGTGIGLTISRRLVELMGGTIGVDSVLGEGSRFWIDLPVGSVDQIDTQGDSSVNDEVAAETLQSRQHSVLYIDDNPVNLKLVSQILSKQPHINLMTTEEPEKGLEMAVSHVPELILLDIHMPRLDGYQVMEQLQQDAALKQIPVIAMTASAMQGDREKCIAAGMQEDKERGRAAGFCDYLTKPLNIKKLLKTIDQHLKA